MTMTESSSEALREELSKAQNEARQARAELEESSKRVLELESQCSKVDTDEQIRALEEQIEDLMEKLKETSVYPLGSPKTQSDDEYIVVEQESPESLSFQLKEREAEIRKAIAHAKKLQELYNAAEERTLNFERQVQVLEANIFEKFDDANALVEKVKEVEELLKAGQIQTDAIEEKSKSSDEAQKKVEYEKVLFLSTEEQLVKNVKKAHDEAEQYRNMILQLETRVKNAEEKAAHAEKCLEVGSLRIQELESEHADLSFQLQGISEELSTYESNKLRSESVLMERDKELAMVQDKAESLEHELQMYRGTEKKVDDDVRSVDEKTVVHEATTSNHPGDTLQEEVLVGESLDNHASSSIEDEMKFLGDNAAASLTYSKQLRSQLEKEAESSKTELKERVKDLEAKVRQLEEEILLSREREERMKQEVKVMEEKASMNEGVSLSYADYTGDLEKKNAKLEQELITAREEGANYTGDLEKKNAKLEQELMTVREEGANYAGDLEKKNAKLEQELITAREEGANYAGDLEKKNATLEQQLITVREEGANYAGDLEKKNATLEQELITVREEGANYAVDLEKKNATLEQQLITVREEGANYAGDLEKKNATLEQELITVREEGANYAVDLEKKNATLEQQLITVREELEALRVCDMCSRLKTQIQDLEVNLGELSLELQESKRREHDAQKELKEKNDSHEQLASEWTEKAASQATEHRSRVQALDARVSELQEEVLLAKASIAKSRLWAQEAASLLRDYADALHKLRGGRCAEEEDLGEEEKEALQAKVEGLYLEFMDMQLCDGSEALQQCKKLFSLERDCLKFQMREMAHKISNLESDLKILEAKRSFRVVTLDGEVQSLKAQLTELPNLRARVSEIPSLQAQLGQLQLSLRAAEKREHEQNLALVKVQREKSAAEEEVCSLKDSLLNQVLPKSEQDNISLKEEISPLVQPEVGLEEQTIDKAFDVASDKVTDEIFLEQASDSKKQADVMQEPPKQKARKRKNRKNGKAPISQEVVEADNRTHSSGKHIIAVYVVAVVLFVLVIGLSMR
ncbi:hypothetical protein KC19_3G228000 [Ceratodon purpureus]|uniref:Uncharacterized protein n=1 Tax=Ceratodon purpureus TaxID=3225 RepID=A0A8T0INV7_CERPU|nr:hypothetical protein KC19_3G228000 [Ceratodon purpureus]